MSSPKIKSITVSSKDSMKSSSIPYIAQGYTVVKKTDRRITLRKSKKFNVAIGIVGFLFGLIGLGIYAIIYAKKPDAEVIDIVIARDADWSFQIFARG